MDGLPEGERINLISVRETLLSSKLNMPHSSPVGWTGNHIADLSDSQNYVVADLRDGRYEVTYLDRRDADDEMRRKVLASRKFASVEEAMKLAERHAAKQPKAD
jgi:hypothetical protein